MKTFEKSIKKVWGVCPAAGAAALFFVPNGLHAATACEYFRKATRKTPHILCGLRIRGRMTAETSIIGVSVGIGASVDNSYGTKLSLLGLPA